MSDTPEETRETTSSSASAPTDAPAPDGGDRAADGQLGQSTSPEHHPDGLHVDAQHAEVDTDQAGGAPVAELSPEEAAQVVAERDDLADQLLRGRADYDNLNKRRHREVAEARDRGAAAVCEALLEVLDNFGFALQAAAASDDAQLAKGVQLVHGQLVQALGNLGLEEVPGVGAPFDPSHHEALMSEEDDVDRDQPEVAEVLRTGYRFKQQLLRAASVKVVN